MSAGKEGGFGRELERVLLVGGLDIGPLFNEEGVFVGGFVALFATAFFAPLTCFTPGYLFAPTPFAPVDLYAPVLGLLDAGTEFDRLTTGLRAVDGRALGEGWYVWPDIAPP